MSLHEDPEFTIQDAADLLPTGNAEAPAAEADPTAFDTEDAGDAVAVEAPAEEPPAAEAPAVLDEDELLEEEAERARPRPESPYDRPGRWYVVHTQSGYEKKVRQNLEARIESMHLEEQVHEVVIPMEDVVEFATVAR